MQENLTTPKIDNKSTTKPKMAPRAVDSGDIGFPVADASGTWVMTDVMFSEIVSLLIWDEDRS